MAEETEIVPLETVEGIGGERWDEEKKGFLLKELAQETGNVLLGWQSREGFGAWSLGYDAATLVTLMKAGDFYGAEGDEVRAAFREGWNRAVNSVSAGDRRLVFEEWKYSEEAVSDEMKREMNRPLKMGERVKKLLHVLGEKKKAVDPRRHYPEIERIMSDALNEWQKEGISCEGFAEPFLRIADLEIPMELLRPEKGGRLIGLTFLPPVRDAYFKTVGVGVKLVAHRVAGSGMELEED